MVSGVKLCAQSGQGLAARELGLSGLALKADSSKEVGTEARAPPHAHAYLSS